MTNHRQFSAIRALGKIAECKYDIQGLANAMAEAPLWRPGVGLRKQCQRTLHIIEDLETRFDRQLVVSIIGPCGSGKSTLLNALSGIDDLSETGTRRPTTRKVVAFCPKASAEFIRKYIGPEHSEIRSHASAENLDQVILVDTPDTDSMEQKDHIPVVHKAVTLSDILICVFNAENPKTRDHVDFFAPYVRMFDGESLIGVLNRCDRLDAGELKRKILPEFKNYLQNAWEKPVQQIFCLSARNHLNDPDWAPGARPRHDFDHFDDLYRLIFGTFNQGGFVLDRRIKNAENLRDNIGRETITAVDDIEDKLSSVRDTIRQVEAAGLGETVSGMGSSGQLSFSSTHAILYQKLSGRWLGPVGWMIAVWARLLTLTGVVASAFRFGRPFRGVIDATRAFKQLNKTTQTTAGEEPEADALLGKYRMVVMQSWPDIAETLIQCGFDASVRKVETALPDSDRLGRDLAGLWRSCLEASIDTQSRKLSGWFLQLIFNLPTVGILVHVGWTTTHEFFSGNYLPSNYFVHAGIIILIALSLSFFVFQSLTRWIGGSERVTRYAVEVARKRAERLHPLTQSDLSRQVDAVLGLVGSASKTNAI